MNDVAIKVENLGKFYRIGQQERYKTLRDTLTDSFTKPFRNLRKLWGRGRSPASDSGDNSFWALKDVSFEVRQGEIIGIIGRNGAGKSTLLKILSSITEPTVGRAEIRGRVGSLLEVGTGFHPELTGRENIYLNGAILGMHKPEIKQKFDEIVAFAEVEKFIDTPVKHYSSGMYLRLAFAVAAHLEPEILLVDEVLAVGDAAFQKKCLGRMEDVAKSGRTVLFVSHNLGAVGSLCEKSILLENGMVSLFAQTNQVIERYQKNCFESTQINNEATFKRPHKITGRALFTGATATPPQKWLDPLVIQFQYEIKEPVERFNVEWYLKDNYGMIVTSGRSGPMDGKWFIPSVDQTGVITSMVKEWRLPGGRYSLCAYLAIPNIEPMDYVEDIILFDVPDMFPGQSGYVFQKKDGLFLTEVIWQSDPNTKIEIM